MTTNMRRIGGGDESNGLEADAHAHSAVAQKLAYTLDEVCPLVSICRSKLYQEIGAGRLPRVKLGRRSLILENDLTEWLTQLRDKAANQRSRP